MPQWDERVVASNEYASARAEELIRQMGAVLEDKADVESFALAALDIDDDDMLLPEHKAMLKKIARKTFEKKRAAKETPA